MGTNLGYLVLIISNLITTNYQYSVVGFFMLRIVKVYERSRKLTKRQLEAYRSNERLIERNREKIESEELKEIPVVSGKVRSSMSEHPYIETHAVVQMDQPDEKDKSKKRIGKWKKEIEEAEKSNEEVDVFIAGINDSKAREIFLLRYIEGKKVGEVGKIIGYTHGRVSQIISKFLKD